MSRIMEAWQSLLRDATAADYDTREYSLFLIGMILARHSAPGATTDPDYYAEHLSRDLLRLTLNDARQQEALDMLVALGRARVQNLGSVFYAISRAQAHLATPALVALLAEIGPKLKPPAAYHAATAINALLQQNTAAFRSAQAQHDITPLLMTWADADDEALADKADLVLAKLGDVPDVPDVPAEDGDD